MVPSTPTPVTHPNNDNCKPGVIGAVLCGVQAVTPTAPGDVTVSGIVRMPGEIQVTLYRTRSPQEGQLTLIFADNPLTLRQWVVTDPQRQQTRVTLYNVRLGGSFDSKLFEFVDPRFFQNNSGGGG